MSPELLATHQIVSLFERSKAFADDVFDHLSGVFLTLDKKGNILRSNNALPNLYRIHPENILGTHVSILFAKDVWPQFLNHFENLVANPAKPIEFELPISLPNGIRKDCLWQIGPLEFLKGEPKNAVFTCVGKDISEVKSAMAKVVTLAKDLEVAEAVQNLLLPATQDLENKDIAMAAAYKSATLVGGDYWSFDIVDHNRIWVLVGDVSGHGAGPAMVTAVVAGCIQTLKAVKQANKLDVDLPSIIKTVNQSLTSIKDQPYWMTMAAVEVDLDKDILRWWTAASPPMFVAFPDGKVQLIMEASRPLGSGACFLSEGELDFPRGARLLILTDGIIETKNAQGREFGLRRLQKFIEDSRKKPVAEARTELIETVAQWRGPAPPADDLTLVLLERK